jgi:23S rRNA pseudouridine1911/1915/1917 synthase
MIDDIDHVVEDGESGDRFDRIVAQAAGTSRAEAKVLVETGAATLDGGSASPSARVEAGSHIVVRKSVRAAAIAASDVPFSIAYEDEAFVIVDKPAGVVVHPGAGHDSDTLVNGLVGRYPELRDLGPERNWGLVHRLDRDTSGLLLVARDQAVHQQLQDDLRARTITREYLALTAGHEFDNATGTIEAPIGRDPRRPTRMAVVRDGRPARTHYVRLAGWPGRTLLHVTLDTGRTHQIRVHLAAISAPVVGDRTYGAAGSALAGLSRVWLHAVRLRFTHPSHGAEIVVRSPLPSELKMVLDAMGPPEVGELPADD